MPQPLNLKANRSSEFTLNLNGCTQAKAPKVGTPILPDVLGTGFQVGSLFLLGALNKTPQSSATAELTPEQQAVQAAGNEAVNIARTMSSDQIKSELNHISSQIDAGSQELTSLREQAKGKDSQAYIDNEANIASLEKEYGFASGSIQTDKDASEQARAGDAYQQACDNYNTLVEGKNSCELKQQTLANSYRELTGGEFGANANGGTIGATQTEIEGYTAQIRELDNKLGNTTQEPGELRQLPSKSQQLTDTQKAFLQEQKSQLEDKKADAQKRLNSLNQERLKLEQENTKNDNDLKNQYTQKKIDEAKNTMDTIADNYKNKNKDVDLSAKYTEYKELINKRNKILSDASVACNNIESKTAELAELKGKQTIYQQALKIKNKITTDDTNISNTTFKQNKKGDNVGKGSWFSRNFGWMWLKGNTAKTQRTNNATFNQLVNQYMANHGCSKKEAQEKVKELQALNKTS